MNKALIIWGNGFDLDLGWKTSYADMYHAKINNFYNLNGMKYISEMIKSELWSDLEGYLRECSIKATQNRIEELNHFWMICLSAMLEYFKINTANIFTTNEKSCAYMFLNRITRKSSIITFNYTNPFKQINIEQKSVVFFHVHGDLDNAQDLEELKLGIDRSALKENKLLKSNNLTHLVKTYGNDNVEKVTDYLKQAVNIVIFGHSLAQADSDYFRLFFKQIESGAIMGKNIYIVTRDSIGLEQIKSNIEKYDVDYDRIMYSCKITPIFTINGKEHDAFQKLLNII